MDKTTQDALAYFKKHDLNHYKFLLTNNFERAVFLKGDPVFPREATRYLWANRNLKENLLGQNVLEIGCSTGYGSQFLPNNINYIGFVEFYFRWNFIFKTYRSKWEIHCFC